MVLGVILTCRDPETGSVDAMQPDLQLRLGDKHKYIYIIMYIYIYVNTYNYIIATDIYLEHQFFQNFGTSS